MIVKRSIILLFILLFFTSSMEAQDSLKLVAPNLKPIRGFVKKIGNKINILPSLKKQHNKPKDTTYKKIYIQKQPRINPYNPIKIVLPDFAKLDYNKLIFWNKRNDFDSLVIAKHKLNQIKKAKIINLRENIEDINSAIYKIEQNKEGLIKQRTALELSINNLNSIDSINNKLKPEIQDALVMTTASLAIPVGYSDIDEQIRNLQLLNKIPEDNSLTIRPYITSSKLTYSKLLALIDTSIKYNGSLYQSPSTNLSLLPIQFSQKLTTDHPYGWNDGSMSYSKGYQFQFSAGVFLEWRNFKIQLRPELVKTAEGNYITSQEWGQVTKKMYKILPGQSSIRYDIGPISFSGSTQNLWWGPGMNNSMLMSNNAPGFFHYSISTNRPLKSFLGNFQFQIITGNLKHDTSQGFENRNLKKLALLNRNRAYNAMALSYQPAFMKNIYFGLTRAFQNLSQNNITGFVPKYLPVLGSFFGSAYNDTINRDQILSFNTRWVFPKNHAEVYVEFGYNDAKDNFRDLMLDFSHSSGYLFGFKKISLINNVDYIDFGAEIIRMSQTPSYLMRNAGNFYEHGRMWEGYTHQNQIMGAGSGFGNNMQTINLSWNRAWNKYGIIFNHVVQNPTQIVSGTIENLGLRTIKWEDFSYGLQGRYRYRNILFSANLEWVYSKNYMWQFNNNRNNFYAFINTIFLW